MACAVGREVKRPEQNLKAKLLMSAHAALV